MSGRNLFHSERIITDLLGTDDDFSFRLGRVSYTKAHTPLKDHIHQGKMEIVLMMKGEQYYTVSGQNYWVRSGEVFVTFPGEIHSSGALPEDKSLLYYVIMDIGETVKQSFAGSLQESADALRCLEKLENRLFKMSGRLIRILDELLRVYYSDCDYKQTKIRNGISGFLIQLIQDEKRQREPEEQGSMQYMLDYIRAHLDTDISIADLAVLAGLSETRFKINFRNQTGLPPGEYILRQKIEAAKALMAATDKSITVIAHDLAFSSSQYFSTVFKRFTLLSPGEYKKKFICR